MIDPEHLKEALKLLDERQDALERLEETLDEVAWLWPQHAAQVNEVKARFTRLDGEDKL